MSPLLPELLQATRRLNHPEVAAALARSGLAFRGGSAWGWDSIEIDGPFYNPVPDGRPALIVPAFEAGELVDLVAISMLTRATKIRAGYATCLGAAWIDRARAGEEALHLFPDPLSWLACGQRGAVILDWSSARFTLADVPRISCRTELLAAKIDQAMRLPVNVPQIFVRETDRAAA